MENKLQLLAEIGNIASRGHYDIQAAAYAKLVAEIDRVNQYINKLESLSAEVALARVIWPEIDINNLELMTVPVDSQNQVKILIMPEPDPVTQSYAEQFEYKTDIVSLKPCVCYATMGYSALGHRLLIKDTKKR